MSTDIYSQVNFTAGQEVREADLDNINNFLAAKLSDQVFFGMLFGKNDDVTDDAHLGGYADPAVMKTYAFVLHPSQAHFRRTSVPNVVQISPGTMYQLVDDPDGTEPKFLPYTFDGTEAVTIASGGGDNTKAIIDIIQMKLELVASDSESRVFITDDTYASLVAPTPNFDGTIMARPKGAAGNKVKFALTPGGALSISEVGNECTITYNDGVSTTLEVETLIQSSSELVAVFSAGTPANVLSSPGDTLALTALAGGISGVLTSQTLDTTRKVQCTLSVKSTTASATPRIPSPDPGYVTIAIIYKNDAHVASSTPGDDKYWYINDGGFTFSEITAGDPAAEYRCCLMDNRMPLGLTPYTVMAKQMHADFSGHWVLYSHDRQMKQDNAAPTGDSQVFIYCPHKVSGRLIAVVLHIDDNAGAYDLSTNVTLAHDPWYPGPNDMSGGYELCYLPCTPLTTTVKTLCGVGAYTYDFQRQHLGAAWSILNILPSLAEDHGPPVWTSGLRAPGYNESTTQAGREVVAEAGGGFLFVHLKPNIPQDVRISSVTFWVAEGL
jgi:hypothetical protein